ncbi:energy-coupling factor transporter transmembrane protein EcfT [Clostridia bacterium]|nr:energy-coupling factor transporter transmembrane protein EcfT [Clostridia bacterium]
MRRYDPRTKLVVVLCLSTLGVIVKDVFLLSLIFIISIILSKHFGSAIRQAAYRLRKLLWMLILIAIMQSVFNGQGEVLLKFNSITLITVGGLMRGLEFLLRMAIVLVSATIVATADQREMVQGLIQAKIPYELAFMVSLGVRFLPILGQELKDTLVAVQLRGIELNHIPWRRRMETYGHLLLPVLVGTVKKAEAISLSMETKGFRARLERSSFKRLLFARKDYIWMSTSLIGTVLLLVVYWL